MSEIIVIDDDSDLEEGEIPDDSSEPEVIKVLLAKDKTKKLPKRYHLKESRESKSKHKDCKSHHRKVKIKISDGKEKNHIRKHKSSCRKNNFEKSTNLDASKKYISKLSVSSGHQRNPINNFSFKGAFKNYSSPPRSVLKSETITSNSCKISESDHSFSKSLFDYKRNQEISNIKIEPVETNSCPKKEDSESLPAFCKADEDITGINSYVNVKSSPILAHQEESANFGESEDEEELRRIALATRSKKAECDQSPFESPISLPCDSTSANKIPTVGTFWTDSENILSDNYEVVDMELDNEGICETFNRDSLFIIDKTPSDSVGLKREGSDEAGEFILGSQNSDSKSVDCLSSAPSESNDDTEAELLRAELIASMNSMQKTFLGVTASEENIPSVVNFIKSSPKLLETNKPFNSYSGERINSVNLFSGKVDKAKSDYAQPSKLLTNKSPTSPVARNVNANNERLIIQINNESSSEESDATEESGKNEPAQEGVSLSSIEALISDARSKSDSANKNSFNSVSCLSKMQQEEYNNLKRILAEKDVLSVQTYALVPTQKQKIQPKPSYNNALAKKILLAKATLKEQILMMNKFEKELIQKKKIYMTAKLKVQHLKEQLQAAEKERALHLNNWTKCSAKLDIVKGSLKKQSGLVTSLQAQFKYRKLNL